LGQRCCSASEGQTTGGYICTPGYECPCY
jgi:hypothetical protein